jgi:hypothetical protein
LSNSAIRRIFRLKFERSAGHSDFGQAGAEWVLSGDEGRAPSCATLLAIVVGASDAFVGDAIDVRGSVAHHAATEIADIPRTDVVTPENQDVRFLWWHIVFSPIWIRF